MELLAPAGDLRAAKAAFAAGADACYVGGLFSARTKNFTSAELTELFEYAHLRDKRVYVAVNTMLFERELDEAMVFLRDLYEEGADAVIAADPGLISMASQLYPQLPLFASTQMGVQDAAGACAARALGCRRVVPAREVTLEGLRAIAQTGVEVEAFCHGALCSGISGACLMSSVIGARSGNRGKCAQPCRMAYALAGGAPQYHLSTADLCALPLLAELKCAGVCSLKIEGRMKRWEYVAIVTDVYRRALDALEEGNFDKRAAIDQLKRIYNRGGFTHGYLCGKRDVTYPTRQNHMGVRVGRVERLLDKGRALVRTAEKLHAGDGIEFSHEHGGLTLAFVGSHPKGQVIPVPAQACAGDEIFLTTDTVQLAHAAELAQDHFSIRVQMRLSLTEEKSAVLEVRAEDRAVCVQSETPLPAAQKPLDVSRVAEWLCKTGGTEFSCASPQINCTGNPFISAAQVNALRREALKELRTALLEAKRPYPRPAKLSAFAKAKAQGWLSGAHAMLSAQVCTMDQACAAWQAGADRVYYTCAPDTDYAALANARAGELYLVLPPFLSPKDWKEVERHTELFDGALAGSLGQVSRAKKLFGRVDVDFILNAANTAAFEAVRSLGAAWVTISAEATLAQIAQVHAPKQAVVYAHLPLMHLRHCPVKKVGKCPNCNQTELTDRRGYAFALHRTGFAECLLQVLNPVPLCMPDVPALRQAGVDALRLMLCRETADETAQAVRAFRTALDENRPADFAPARSNTGHYYRGV